MNKDADLKHHRRRLRAAARFKWYGRGALFLAGLSLVVLLMQIVERGVSGLRQGQIELTVTQSLSARDALQQNIPPELIDPENRRLSRMLGDMLGPQAEDIVKTSEEARKIWLPLSSAAERWVKLRGQGEDFGRLDEVQIQWLKHFQDEGKLRLVFDREFFKHGDSRSPEQAGFLGAMAGSALTLAICLAVSFPLGVMTAVYLEEFARKGKWVDFIEVNINNLAAVPSIVFGLLGLSLYLLFFGLPRSSPLVGGLTLALMCLPVIIIATRASIKAVPPSIRDAARAIGASPVQVVWHHTLPLAAPGIITGTILSLARAIGETAPLLMIGMVAFIADIPDGFTDPATVMPVQIYLWATSPEAGFVEKTASGILVLLTLLLAMNTLAIYIRKRFEVKW